MTNPKPEHKDSGKNEFVHVTRFDYDSYHFAEIQDPEGLRFLKYRDGDYEKVGSQVEIGEIGGRKIIALVAPQIGQTRNDKFLRRQRVEPIKFPAEPRDYGTEYDFYLRVKDFICNHVELRGEDAIILSLYVMKAALFDVLNDNSFPFVHVIAPYGKGKSRLLTTLCEVTPYGFYTIDIKSAPLKRISDQYFPIIYVDEKGKLDHDTSSTINAKYNRNSVIVNADQNIQRGMKSIIGYSIFGPLVIASRTPFNDDAIESKSFQINMDFELTKDYIPRKLKGKVLDEFNLTGGEIRSELLMFRIRWHDRINEIDPGDFLKQYESLSEPRLFEIISFFEDLLEIMPELKDEISSVLEAQIIANVEVASETPNGEIANLFLNKVESVENPLEYLAHGVKHKGILLNSIYEDIGPNYSKQAGKILSALGIKTDRPTIEVTIRGKSGEEEKYKKKVTVARIPCDKKLNELRSRYDSEFVRGKLTGIPKAQQSKLDEEDGEDVEKNDSAT